MSPDPPVGLSEPLPSLEHPLGLNNGSDVRAYGREQYRAILRGLGALLLADPSKKFGGIERRLRAGLQAEATVLQ